MLLEKMKAMQPAQSVTVVVFLGGCTRAEISALQTLSKRLKQSIYIVTTAQISGRGLIETMRLQFA